MRAEKTAMFEKLKKGPNQENTNGGLRYLPRKKFEDLKKKRRKTKKIKN